MMESYVPVRLAPRGPADAQRRSTGLARHQDNEGDDDDDA